MFTAAAVLPSLHGAVDVASVKHLQPRVNSCHQHNQHSTRRPSTDLQWVQRLGLLLSSAQFHAAQSQDSIIETVSCLETTGYSDRCQQERHQWTAGSAASRSSCGQRGP
jgi:hypothetical protein